LSNTILLLDDSEDELFITKYLISKLNHFDKILTSKNGLEVLELLDLQSKKPALAVDYPPQFMLVDINMPIMDGFEFLDKYHEWLEQNPDQTAIKIAIMSSSKRDQDLEQASHYQHVIDFIFKPLTREKFEAFLKKA